MRGAGRYVVSEGRDSHELVLSDPYPVAVKASDEEAHPGAPMPGTIVAIEVREGEHVERGQPLLVLEGMKMEYTVRARAAGEVEHLLVQMGDTVEAEIPLVDIVTDACVKVQ